jgi:hypothetical protein
MNVNVPLLENDRLQDETVIRYVTSTLIMIIHTELCTRQAQDTADL